MRRRQVVGWILALPLFDVTRSVAETSLQAFDSNVALLANNPNLSGGHPRSDDRAFAIEYGAERAPLRIPKSSTPISSRATDLIVASEVSGKVAYTNKYVRPIWPGGASGITIGIGYDIGYVKPDEFAADWKGYISDSLIEQLSAACGITGTAASDLLASLSDARIPWDPAMKQYLEQTQPRYVGLTEAALPNTKKLKPDCLGALVSLTYNRGASYNVQEARDKTGRFKEMRAIKAFMISEQFDQIPGEIRNMKRIWDGIDGMRGVLIRRDAEAALFELGLGG